MDPNPYEPPSEPEPLTPGKIIKHGLGVTTIILLTPIAVAVAFGASCAATNVVLNMDAINKAGLGTVIVVGYAVFLIPPAIMLTAMIWWATWTHRRNRKLSGKAEEER